MQMVPLEAAGRRHQPQAHICASVTQSKMCHHEWDYASVLVVHALAQTLRVVFRGGQQKLGQILPSGAILNVSVV